MKKIKITLANPPKICTFTVKKTVEKEFCGSVETVIEDVEEPLFKRHDIPSREEYSFEHQVAAGVNMKLIPTSHMLDPQDPAQIINNNEALAEEYMTELENSSTKTE